VIETRIHVEPEPTPLSLRRDYFGNDIMAFSVLENHAAFSVMAASVVDVVPQPVPASAITWEEARDRLANPSEPECLRASEFIYSSPYVPLSAELDRYAGETFAPRRPLMDAVMELSARIHTEFKYEPAATSIDTPLGESLRKRRGVCQDFAHIMIGALRTMGLAARYVSGYVRTGSRYQGAQASHAWVSVFVPGAGWVSMDPTNNVTPSDSHVTVAYGRDYGDVAPVKGVTLGGGKQTVAVEVWVKPVSTEKRAQE
jgi:transglutaminase-like putative cysteine protease